MVNQGITPGKLKSLRNLDQNIAWCEHELDHGYLVCEESVGEWATRAEKQLPPEEFAKAMRAVENTRNRIRAVRERAIRERDTLLAWIDAIPREDVRVSMFLHYAKGYSWSVIAEQYFGGSVTFEGVRQMCGRYIRGEHMGERGRPRIRKEGGTGDTGTVKESPGDGRTGNVSASTAGAVAGDPSETDGDPCPAGS